MGMPRFVSRSPAETRRIAAQFIRSLAASGRTPFVIGLQGDLGAGKTAFIQGMGRTLGIQGRIQSPTFVIVRRHRLSKPFVGRHHLVHVDAYRLATLREARNIGLGRILNDPDAIVAVEWADRIKRLIPNGAYWVRFRHGRHHCERIVECKIQTSKIKI